jgi:hypothetical protein
MMRADGLVENEFLSCFFYHFDIHPLEMTLFFTLENEGKMPFLLMNL